MKVPRRRLVLVVHNVRSAHNVGSLLRTADGLGLEKVYLSGYSPYPEAPGDTRPPHIRQRVSAAVAKTALGAEIAVDWEYRPEIESCLAELKTRGFLIAALEQTPEAIDLHDFGSNLDIALVVGNEVEGLDADSLSLIRTHLQIPMHGVKESFNVSAAAAMALHHLRYLDKNTA
jgi:23S rRNA (guanosine2251-2'-O)-methyltransferase